MPIYVYKNPKTGEIFEKLRKMSESHLPFIDEDGTECERIMFPQGSTFGNINKNKEVWEVDPSYVKKIKPKYVRRRDGIREKYDPTKHC